MPAPDEVDPFQRYRVLDANLNRACEAFRVVEEIARFSLGDGHLTRQLKQLRHQLSQLFKTLQPQLLRARDTSSDVGTSISTPTETSRDDLAAVAAANFDRLGQSLRTLEEFAKLTDRQLAGHLEQIRYQTYSLEKAIVCARQGAETWRDRRLYAIVAAEPNQEQFAQTVQGLIDAGVDILQLRDQTLPDRQLLERAKTLVKLARPANVLSIINDRIDIALAALADGVHLGQEDLPLPDVRGLLSDQMLVGLSTHSLEQARAAELMGADYIGVGPTFRSATKQFANFPGLALLEQVVPDISIPCFAIGGIDTTNVKEVAATGIKRVAVCGALQDLRCAADIAASIKGALRRQIPPAPTVIR